MTKKEVPGSPCLITLKIGRGPGRSEKNTRCKCNMEKIEISKNDTLLRDDFSVWFIFSFNAQGYGFNPKKMTRKFKGFPLVKWFAEPKICVTLGILLCIKPRCLERSKLKFQDLVVQVKIVNITYGTVTESMNSQCLHVFGLYLVLESFWCNLLCTVPGFSSQRSNETKRRFHHPLGLFFWEVPKDMHLEKKHENITVNGSERGATTNITSWYKSLVRTCTAETQQSSCDYTPPNATYQTPTTSDTWRKLNLSTLKLTPWKIHHLMVLYLSAKMGFSMAMLVFRECIPIFYVTFFGAQRFGRLLGQEHLAREIGGIFRWTGLTLTGGKPPVQASAFWGKFRANSIEDWRYWIFWNARISKEHTFIKNIEELLIMICLNILMIPQPLACFCSGYISPIKNWVTPMAMEGFQSIALRRSNCPSNPPNLRGSMVPGQPFHFQKPLLVYNRISSYFFQLYFGYREVFFFSPH